MHSHFHVSPLILTASNSEQFGFFFRQTFNVNINKFLPVSTDKQEEVGKHLFHLSEPKKATTTLVYFG